MTAFNIDEKLLDADWLRSVSWSLPTDREEFKAWALTAGVVPEVFKSLPIYHAPDRPDWVAEVLEEVREELAKLKAAETAKE